LIVSIIALVKDEIIIVKTSLIGSILSNLLLVMGMCFFFGGLRREEQFFNVTVATTAASLLALAIAAIIIPSAFNQFSIANDTADTAVQKTHRTASISRATAIILLFVYACHLIFQLKTHSAIYMQKSKKAVVKPSKRKLPEGSVVKALAAAGGIGAGPGRTNPESSNLQTTDELLQTNAYELQRMAEDEEDDEPNLHIGVAVGLLAGCTVVIALCAEFMVDAISAITDGGSVSAEFVGLILLPIVGNAAEHATAVTVAVKDKMDLAIGVAVGSSMQVALLIIPLTVVLGWGLGKDTMDLSFDGFQVAVLFVSVLLVNYLISDGKSSKHFLNVFSLRT
jgi:Ca2+:H+ antiporter